LGGAFLTTPTGSFDRPFGGNAKNSPVPLYIFGSQDENPTAKCHFDIERKKKTK
jgi:hypothetical protein